MDGAAEWGIDCETLDYWHVSVCRGAGVRLDPTVGCNIIAANT